MTFQFDLKNIDRLVNLIIKGLEHEETFNQSNAFDFHFPHVKGRITYIRDTNEYDEDTMNLNVMVSPLGERFTEKEEQWLEHYHYKASDVGMQKEYSLIISKINVPN